MKTQRELEIYRQGIIAGLTQFAWWKDGVQYVGTCGTTLKQAIQDTETIGSIDEEH